MNSNANLINVKKGPKSWERTIGEGGHSLEVGLGIIRVPTSQDGKTF